MPGWASAWAGACGWWRRACLAYSDGCTVGVLSLTEMNAQTSDGLVCESDLSEAVFKKWTKTQNNRKVSYCRRTGSPDPGASLDSGPWPPQPRPRPQRAADHSDSSRQARCLPVKQLRRLFSTVQLSGLCSQRCVCLSMENSVCMVSHVQPGQEEDRWPVGSARRTLSFLWGRGIHDGACPL